MPLSADAFISQVQTPESQRDDFEVIMAGKILRHVLIPKFVESLETLDTLPYDSVTLTNAFHTNGINMRYLGVICKQATLPHIKALCIQEMISRSVKKILRKQLSDLVIKGVEEQGGSFVIYVTDELGGTKQAAFLRKMDKERIEIIVDFFELTLWNWQGVR